MGDHIVGMKKMREISATVKGANEHCTKVFQKSFRGQPTTQPGPGHTDPGQAEESVMDAKIMKSFAGLQARTGNDGALYVAQLEDDKVKTFFEQDAAAQDAEVKTWADAEKEKAEAAAAAEKAKTAGNPEVEELKSELAGLKAERQVEKAAVRDGELREIAKSQYGSVPKAYETLKSAEKLSEEDRKPILETLKSQQEMAKRFGTTLGDDAADADGSAKVKYDNRLGEIVKEKSITKAEARVVLAESSDPADRQLVRDYREEMNTPAA